MKNTFLSSGNRESCYGCLSCSYVCPKEIIQIEEDVGGFKYPIILSPELCINCGLCRRVCPHDNAPDSKSKSLIALKSGRDEIRKSSSSGGAFTVISDILLKQNYKIYGCILDENFKAVHIGSFGERDRDRMRKSKYVASDIRGLFPQIKDDLEHKINVCFTGTPCQVHALWLFLQKKYDNLITIDFLCHGVSSPNLFKDYVDMCRKGSEIEKIEFRDKEFFPWRTTEVKVHRLDGKTSSYERSYMKMFFRGFGFRKSCGTCKMARPERASDITIADFWSIHRFYPEMEDSLGVSAVFFNSCTGERYRGEIEESAITKEVSIQNALQTFGPMNQSEPVSLIDDYFWKCYAKYPKEKLFQIFGGDSIKSKMTRKSREYLASVTGRIKRK